MQLTSRRTFLQHGSMAAAALVSSSAQRLWANPLNQPIGIQLYTVGDALRKDVPGTLKRVRAIGYRVVETAGSAGLTAVQFKNALDNAGLKCPSAHLQLNTADLSPLFADAHTLGAHYAVSSMLQIGKSLNDYKNLAAKMNRIGQKAKQAGLQYAYHNHDFEFADLGGGKIGYDVLLKETDPELVSFELDCGWMFIAGYSPLTYFHNYPHRYKMLHIKDFVKGSTRSRSISGPTRPQGAELGRGIPDYKSIFAAAAKIGIKHYFVEQEPPFLDMTSLQAAKVDYDYLHAL